MKRRERRAPARSPGALEGGFQTWIGVGRADVSAPSPSKPDERVSRIRLSSRWVLSREGAALRLVPKCVGQTFGVTQAYVYSADSTTAEPARALALVFVSVFLSFALPPSCVPWL